MDDLLRVNDLERVRHLPEDSPRTLDLHAASRSAVEHPLERRAADVLEHDEGQRVRRTIRRRDHRRRVVEESDDVRIGLALLREHPEDVCFALEAAKRVGVHGIGPEHLDDDDEPAGLVPVRREDPALPTFADALAKVVLHAPAPAEHTAHEAVA